MPAAVKIRLQRRRLTSGVRPPKRTGQAGILNAPAIGCSIVCMMPRRSASSEPLWRFCFPTAVDFDQKSDRIIVADSQRNRLQIYCKMRDYVDFQANL
jgi:hypothetical protein